MTGEINQNQWKYTFPWINSDFTQITDQANGERGKKCLFWYYIDVHFKTTTSHLETREWKNKSKVKTDKNKSSYMSFHGCFLLTQEERQGGQRAEEGGQRRPHSLSTHNLLIQSSHNMGRSEVKKVSHSLFYIQTAAQVIHLFILWHNWAPSCTSDPGSSVKLELRLDKGWQFEKQDSKNILNSYRLVIHQQWETKWTSKVC